MAQRPLKNRRISYNWIMNLLDPVESLKGVGPKTAEILQKSGIKTVRDFLYNLPRDYENYQPSPPRTSLQRPQSTNKTPPAPPPGKIVNVFDCIHNSILEGRKISFYPFPKKLGLARAFSVVFLSIIFSFRSRTLQELYILRNSSHTQFCQTQNDTVLSILQFPSTY